MNPEPAPGPLGIREADVGDTDPIVRLVRDCTGGMRAAGIEQWDEVYPDRATIAADIGSRSAFVAAHQGELVGMVVLNEHQDPEYADVPWTCLGRPAVVHRLMVAPPWEGRGVGRALVQFVERRALAQGYGCIRLDAFSENPRALRLYEGSGYRRVGRVRFRKGLFDCFEKPLLRAG
jgi:GNAT superfamily N-acetyltransferase